MTQTEIHIANFVVNWLLPFALGIAIATILVYGALLVFIVALCKAADRPEPKP